MSKVLIAGPWLGEFGWELLVWQAAVRFYRKKYNYEKVYVITFKGRKPLYENSNLYVHDLKLKDAIFGIPRIEKNVINQYIQQCVEHFNIKENYDVFTPNDLFSLKYRILRKFNKKYGLEYKKLGEEKEIKYDICFHFRHFNRKGDNEDKNLSLSKANKLVEHYVKKGYKVCCIGLPGYSYVPEGAVNCQSDSLEATISTISESRMVVGGSSAPMHLAQLCGKPIVTWINVPEGGKRYTKTWNPFNTKALIVSGKSWNPDIQDIIFNINNLLELKYK